MKKLCLASLAVATLAPSAWAQSSVTLYGIMDLAIRSTNNQGTKASGSPSGTAHGMIGGGMSESRWGINVTEDLGDGLKAIGNLEARFAGQTGAISTPMFQQSWVGLQSNRFGRLTMGRQWNILFDLTASSYASFPYSPFFQTYKPEIGFALGGRTSNALKYMAEFGHVRLALQYSKAQNTFPAGTAYAAAAPHGDTLGGYLRYADGGLAVGAGYMSYGLSSGHKVKATTLGGSYRTGPWYLTLGWGQNKLESGTQTMFTAGPLAGKPTPDGAVLSSFWGGSESGGFGGAAFLGANKRQMTQVGVGYQLTPKINLGAHYFRAKQSGSLASSSATADFFITALDYALSKRTDAYVAVDHTKLSGNVSLSGSDGSYAGAKSRTGYTIGLRHRF